MNKHDARKLADTITNEQLLQMFKNAKDGVKDWEKTSIVNIGMTKGTAWNILAKDFDVSKQYHPIAKSNMIREFGDWLPCELQPNKKPKKEQPKPVHQQPNLEDWL